MKPMCGLMKNQRPDSRIAQEDFKTVSCSGVAIQDGLDIFVYISEKRHNASPS
jgi:hypothetical protein